jgi:hypothetical protein
MLVAYEVGFLKLISGRSCYEKSNSNHGQTAKERAGAEK